MCGIIGYIGKKNSLPILINGLKKLEYRGYDSAGIAYLNNDNIKITKEVGRISELEKIIDSKDESYIGIGHTRWATHGGVTKENSHPHQIGDITIVHNGIIENYNEIKNFLIDNGYTFYSQTDTEVIPNLIHYYYAKDNKDDDLKVLRAINSACKDFKGSFAIQVISKYLPDNLIVVRKDSPLVIGKGNNENYISSDIPAILSFTKNFYLLNDYEFAILSRNTIKFYDKKCENLFKKMLKLASANKN